MIQDYEVPKVVRIIISYTNYVNRVVWHKQTEYTARSLEDLPN